MPVIHYVLAILLTAASVVVARTRRYSNMPPGPPRSFWGYGDNSHQFPRRQPWKVLAAWRYTYGPVVSLFLGAKPIIILNTAQAAWELMGTKGKIYSSRPRFIIGGEILSGGMRGIGMPYGDRWRKWRKLIGTGLSLRAAQSYLRLQSLESTLLLRDLLVSPELYGQHFERHATSVMISITYGRRVSTLDDPVTIKNRRISEYFGSVNVPGKFLVETFPILLWLPHWLQWFRWEPERRQAHDTKIYLDLMDEVERKMHSGTANKCLTTHAIEMGAENELDRVETAYALSAPFSGGIDTQVSTLKVFLVAMLHHPSTAEAAQRELDTVVGSERLPTFSDEANLPYVGALIKEVLRWRTVAPLGVPHSVIDDDTYEGMFIPKGSTVYANIYAMSRQEDMFPDADKFKPERFLDTQEKHLLQFNMCFGFGRRICPGMYVASHSLFINIARMLWAFKIMAPEDADGKVILPDPDNFTGGLVVRPLPFAVQLHLRNPKAAEIITVDATNAEEELRKYN